MPAPRMQRGKSDFWSQTMLPYLQRVGSGQYIDQGLQRFEDAARQAYSGGQGDALPGLLADMAPGGGLIGQVRRVPKIAYQEVGQYPVGSRAAREPEEIAHLVAPLRKNPQEQLLGIHRDAAGDALAIHRHTQGTESASAAQPFSLLGGAYADPRVSSITLAHNHPSGFAQQSDSDTRLTDMLSSVTEGTGLDFGGMTVVAPGGQASHYWPAGWGSEPVNINPMARTSSIPVLERRFRSVGTPGKAITSPDSFTRQAMEMADGGTGVLLADNKLMPTTFVPMSPAEMAQLRTGDKTTGAGRLIAEMDRTNSNSGFVVTDAARDPAVANVANFFDDIGLRGKVMDAMDYESGRYWGGLDSIPGRGSRFKAVAPLAGAGLLAPYYFDDEGVY